MSRGEPETQRLVANVRGIVQGVGFRRYVRREAALLRLEGWVTNQDDGSVEIVAQGQQASLHDLVVALWRGPAECA